MYTFLLTYNIQFNSNNCDLNPDQLKTMQVPNQDQTRTKQESNQDPSTRPNQDQTWAKLGPKQDQTMSKPRPNHRTKSGSNSNKIFSCRHFW